MFGVVAEPEPDGVVDRDAVELGRVDEPHVGGLVADCEGAADDAAVVGDVELLADFAVGVGDHVLRVGVDAEEADDLDVKKATRLKPGRAHALQAYGPARTPTKR